MITVENVCKNFGKFKVLADINFNVKPSSIYGLIGYNGVGKTTLLKIISGIYRADQGSVFIDGKKIYENEELKRQIFLMTEEVAFFSQASLYDMRKFYRGYYPQWSDKTFHALVKVFGIQEKKKINQFSKGMQRQAGLIIAFSTHAKYLFLDEAFDGLDFTMRRLMRQLLIYYKVQFDAHIIISSHNLQELDGLADEIGMLSEGKLVYNDTSSRMKQEYKSCLFKDSFNQGKSFFENQLQKLCLIEESEDGMFAILNGTEEEIKQQFLELPVERLQIRPITLEEFFYKERREIEVDWKDIF